MLNEEKVILMTQMASYEENEGKKNMAIGRYFRSDYQPDRQNPDQRADPEPDQPVLPRNWEKLQPPGHDPSI